ncbi:MAG: tRNA glutamyl-Q(34) synthetase GluQRS [Gammaproteobacteria bacterium]|nr:tRNA glutamyl-Q(34) synthetase GluQRS [Gammaproteobacteria bacterium]
MNSPSAVPKHSYIGRFAPSPSGPLHFGSLMAAVASYLDAKANKGQWLVRIEDLDPPREPKGASEQILEQLNALKLEWDGEVLYQSSRLENYMQALNDLSERNLCFQCNCSRKRIKSIGSIYDGYCRNRMNLDTKGCAIRVIADEIDLEFKDLVHGNYKKNIGTEIGDFIIVRRDKLFAYQLAVVVDDAFQKVTHIIRGYDLIHSTPRQIYLQQLLNFPTPLYGHIPIVVNDQGQKLSKQHFATPIDAKEGPELIHRAFVLLGLSPPKGNKSAPVQEQLHWGIKKWDMQTVPKLANIPEDKPAKE